MHHNILNKIVHPSLIMVISRSSRQSEALEQPTNLELLYSVTITGIGEDKVCWQPSQSHTFQVKSYYNTFTCKGEGCFPWKSIWKAKVPPRVAFFTWTAALGRILTADNLWRRRVILFNWCCMCKADGESIDHLLLHCVYAKELWDMVFAMFGIHWVMRGRVRDLFACWQGKMGRHLNDMIWRFVPHCLMWCFWRECNTRIFEGCEQHVDELKILFLCTLFERMSSIRLFCFSTLLEFKDFCCF